MLEINFFKRIFFCLSFTMLTFQVFSQVLNSDCRDSLIVNRWWRIDYGVNKDKCQIIERRRYCNDRVLQKIEYIRGASNVKDSIIYIYSRDKKLIQQIVYTPKYTALSSEPLVEQKILQGSSLEGQKSHERVEAYFLIRDSLKLLINEYSQISLLLEKSKLIKVVDSSSGSNNSKKYQFSANYIPSVLTEYGVPFNAFLKTWSVVVKDNRIILDEFIFNQFKVVRKLKYNQGRIKIITTSLKQKRSEQIFEEGFEYN